MNWYLTATILSYSILLPLFFAIKKKRQCGGTYLPFFLLLVCAAVNEAISTVVIYNGYSNSVNNNIYILAESILLIWLFKKWKPDKMQDKSYILLCVVMCIIWIADNVLIHDITSFTGYYRVYYSIVVVFLAGDQLGYLLMNENRIVGNTRLILCITFIINYCYNCFIELMVIMEPGFSDDFYEGFFLIRIVVNTITNICFTIAVAWIPKKEKYYITY